MLLVTDTIAGDFVLPIGRVALHLACAIDTMRAAMPETTMNEHACAASRKYKIGFSRQVALVKTEAQAFAVEEPPYGKLGRCVSAPDATHVPATGFWAQLVHWASIKYCNARLSKVFS